MASTRRIHMNKNSFAMSNRWKRAISSAPGLLGKRRRRRDAVGHIRVHQHHPPRRWAHLLQATKLLPQPGRLRRQSAVQPSSHHSTAHLNSLMTSVCWTRALDLRVRGAQVAISSYTLRRVERQAVLLAAC